jgi:hypothetical protein
MSNCDAVSPICSVWLSVALRFAAIMLGRLRMDVDDCITEYSSVVRIMNAAEPNKLSSTALEAAVADVVTRYAGSSTEAFHSSAEADCKVCVKFLCQKWDAQSLMTSHCFQHYFFDDARVARDHESQRLQRSWLFRHRHDDK